MSRVLLLILFLLWLSWSPQASHEPGIGLLSGTGVFLGVLALVVLGSGWWSRRLARRVTGTNLRRSMKRFNRLMFAARVAIPLWFGVGLFLLGWGQMVTQWVGPGGQRRFELPAVLLATLPAVLAWVGLWWAQFPADRALREQSLLGQLDQDLPIHASPGFWQYMQANLRLQLLFTLVPVLLILLVRDVGMLALRLAGMSHGKLLEIEPGLMLAGTALVFVLAPEILRRVLETEPLPASSLRSRLEALCRRHRLKYREILLWQTQGSMGNAAVMGLLPRVRYVLLSDLLLETMTDQQIESVFAHELGHIVHRHMLWYGVLVVILMLTTAAAGAMMDRQLVGVQLPGWLQPDLVSMLGGVGSFVLVFGYLSRRFERQADVFAARTMQGEEVLQRPVALEDLTAAAKPEANPSHVGAYGAALFGSALHRVAIVNNIPVETRSWWHGSIAHRMSYLRQLAGHPQHTWRFDRYMRRLYWLIVLVLIFSGAWAGWQFWHG